MQSLFYSLLIFLIGYAVCWYSSQRTDYPLWPKWPL